MIERWPFFFIKMILALSKSDMKRCLTSMAHLAKKVSVPGPIHSNFSKIIDCFLTKMPKRRNVDKNFLCRTEDRSLSRTFYSYLAQMPSH